MTTALTPRLRPLDERVLAALRWARGRRASAIAKDIHGAAGWRCEDCGNVTTGGAVSDRRRADWEQQRPQMWCSGWADGCDGREWPVLLVTAEQSVRSGRFCVALSVLVGHGRLAAGGGRHDHHKACYRQ